MKVRSALHWFIFINLLWVNEASYAKSFCYTDSPPYAFDASAPGEAPLLAGYVIELMHLLLPSDALNLQLMPWARCQRAAELGQVDGIMQIGYTPERGNYLFFTDITFSSVKRVFFRFDLAFNWHSVNQLMPYRMAVLRGDLLPTDIAEAIALGQFPYLSTVNQAHQLFDMISHNRADFVIFEQQAGQWYIDAIGATHLVVSMGRPLSDIGWSIAISKHTQGGQDLVKQLNSQLARLKQQGEIEKILTLNKEQLIARSKARKMKLLNHVNSKQVE